MNLAKELISKLLASAEDVTDSYSGAIWDPESRRCYDDLDHLIGYYHSLTLNNYGDEEYSGDLPKEVFTCLSVTFSPPHPNDYIGEYISEEHGYTADLPQTSWAELDKLWTEWVAKQDLVSNRMDDTRKITVDWDFHRREWQF